MIAGDVQGKGLAAVETADVVLGAFREAAHDEPDLLGLGETEVVDRVTVGLSARWSGRGKASVAAVDRVG